MFVVLGLNDYSFCNWSSTIFAFPPFRRLTVNHCFLIAYDWIKLSTFLSLLLIHESRGIVWQVDRGWEKNQSVVTQIHLVRSIPMQMTANSSANLECLGLEQFNPTISLSWFALIENFELKKQTRIIFRTICFHKYGFCTLFLNKCLPIWNSYCNYL